MDRQVYPSAERAVRPSRHFLNAVDQKAIQLKDRPPAQPSRQLLAKIATLGGPRSSSCRLPPPHSAARPGAPLFGGRLRRFLVLTAVPLGHMLRLMTATNLCLGIDEAKWELRTLSPRPSILRLHSSFSWRSPGQRSKIYFARIAYRL